jgi:hypothetical protein
LKPPSVQQKPFQGRELWSTRRASWRGRVTMRDKNKRTVQKFNSGSLLFIGARGVVLRNLPRLDRYRVFGWRVYPLTFRGWRFFTKFPKCSWNRIVGVNPLPQGASVGEFRKTRHPRNVEFNEFLRYVFQRQGTCDFQESWTCEALESRICDFRESWTCEASESRICDFWESWTCKASESWTRESQESRIGEVTNFGGWKIRESARSLFRKSRTGNSRTSGKQSQSCRPKKSGFGVWTSGKLVNIWYEKDILVCVHIRNILRARGCFRNVKVPSSPYKRGREGTWK